MSIMKRPDSIKPVPQDRKGVEAPPGQFITEKFPNLTFGSIPRMNLSTWRFRVFGMVDKEMELTWEQFTALPQITLDADFHCVTQWSRLNNTWEGVPFSEVVKLVKPSPSARFAMVHCYGGYSTNLEIETLLSNHVLFALKHDDEPLTPEHGWPLRLVVPQRYGWKSAKWVNGLELMEHNKPGFWELRGYHMKGDPWKEERFWPELT